jgi:serine/threonine protein kinase
MGNSSLRPSLAADATVNFQADLPKFILQSKIGNGKLMKTYLMRCESNSVVVKVYMSYPDEDIRVFAAELTRIWYTLSPSKFPNLLPYQLWMKSTSRQPKSTLLPTYLIRQYLYSNLHDRISTRPFLNEIEKHWLIFQIFKCLETCHDLEIMHGDIKPENVLCTTSNWIVLTDFAAFKPVNIPDDNPSDYHYFFDSMGRPRCYLAPERFCNQSVLVKWRGMTSGVSSDRIGSQSSQPLLLLNAVSSKQNTTVSSTSSSSLLSFERNTDNALMSDSVFGDAATAIRFQGADSDKHAARIVVVSDTDKGKEKESSDGDDSYSSKPYPSLTPAMDVFSLGCTIAEVYHLSFLLLVSNFAKFPNCFPNLLLALLRSPEHEKGNILLMLVILRVLCSSIV